MKKLLIVLMALTCLPAFASLDIGICKVSGISDTAADNSNPHRFYSANHGNITLEKCLKKFDRNLHHIKRCGVIVGGTIHYVELEFVINGRTLKSVEPIGIDCI